jgi:hypothetical protein
LLQKMAALVVPVERVARAVAHFLATVEMAGLAAMAELVAMVVTVGFLLTGAVKSPATAVVAYFVAIQSA